MKIEVTQRHIDDGIPWCSDWCPISLAVEDATGKKCYSYQIGLIIRGARVSIPRFVSCWMTAFDLGKLVYPFSFDLEVVGKAAADPEAFASKQR